MLTADTLPPGHSQQDAEQAELTAMSGEKQDERWGDYLPTFLRIRGLALTGDCSQFLARISQRLSRLFQFNEAGFPNLDYIGAVIETETLQRFSVGERVGGRCCLR
jgi:hypothetical protein